MSHSGQNKQGGGQSQAQASDILFACYGMHLHISVPYISVGECLLCEVRVCNNSIRNSSKQCNYLQLWQMGTVY